MKVTNAVTASDQQLAAFFNAPEDGPFVMINLLKFKPKAEYADGSDPDISGAAAYGRYGAAVTKMIEQLGGRIVYGGVTTSLMLGQVEELWDSVGLVEYPSMAAFRAMITSPEYAAISHHRTAGLAGQLNIRTKPGGSL
jgi:uncharacterized protein (DUF1330 family)